MSNSSSKEIQILQKKAADLEAKLVEKEMSITRYLNERKTLETALQEIEQQRQKLTIENDVLGLEMETKERLHQEKIDAL